MVHNERDADGKQIFRFTAGGVEYKVGTWAEVIEILNEKDTSPAIPGYGKGTYNGD